MKVTVYGIGSCSTVKTYAKQLSENGVEVEFFDYLKQSVPQDFLTAAVATLGWEQVVNHRARNLKSIPETESKYLLALTGSQWDEQAFSYLKAQPRIIKRPIVQIGDQYFVNKSVAEIVALAK